MYAISKARRLHQEYVVTLSSQVEQYIPIKDLAKTVGSFLSPSSLMYWVEAELFYLSVHDWFLTHMSEIIKTEPLLQSFDVYAKECWIMHYHYNRDYGDRYSFNKYFGWASDCNRGLCFAESRCFCDDSLTPPVLRDRTNHEKSESN